MGNRDKNFRQRRSPSNCLMRRGVSCQPEQLRSRIGDTSGEPAVGGLVIITTFPAIRLLDNNRAREGERQERLMRWMLVLLLLVGAALLAKPQPATAQAAVSAYPWCLEKFTSGRRSCYYSTWEQCLYDARPLGGVCIQSPYYRGPQPRGFAGPEALGPGAPYYRGPEARYSAEPTGGPPRPPAHRRHHRHS
jgi:uncharacterized protein DUF3551